VIPTSIPLPGGGAGAPSSSHIYTDEHGSTITTPKAVITATTRARSTDAPTLFGVQSGAWGRYQEVVELVTVVVCGLVGVLSVVRLV